MYSRFGKRCFDVAAVLLILPAAVPAMLIVASLVRWALGRPVLFRQVRAGREGVAFELLKFRSMRLGPGEDADRLTRFGRLLRATALDELPQLLNILRGEMSLVGPRPLLPEYTARYTARQRTRLAVRPGLCGLAQAQGRNAVPWDERLEWDARYVERVTFGGDLAIIWRCARVVGRGQGASMAGHATMERFDKG
ncbi:sugar transferase [Roseococcus sp. YIM B11640]|uniref:sugar transferase n=1 Tax=Roseococcus sp. YIM B11640 TaxID=3133973 RepID=UPI003C7D64AD